MHAISNGLAYMHMVPKGPCIQAHTAPNAPQHTQSLTPPPLSPPQKVFNAHAPLHVQVRVIQNVREMVNACVTVCVHDYTC